MSHIVGNILFADRSPTATRLSKCLIANAVLLSAICITVGIMHENGDPYFRAGWNDSLVVLGIKINTPVKYIAFQAFICILEAITVIINDIANPILGFSIFNPDKKIITDFTKNNLQFLANAMWIINGLKSTMTVVVTISQIDIAILRVLYSEVTSFYTIRMLLNDKTFTSENIEELAEIVIQ
jgi:hypothetical protein